MIKPCMGEIDGNEPTDKASDPLISFNLNELIDPGPIVHVLNAFVF